MTALLVLHKVNEYATWKPAFDEHGATRRADDAQGGRLYRNAADPTETLILLDWDDFDRARLFAHSVDPRQAMARAGVVGQVAAWSGRSTPSDEEPTWEDAAWQ